MHRSIRRMSPHHEPVLLDDFADPLRPVVNASISAKSNSTMPCSAAKLRTIRSDNRISDMRVLMTSGMDLKDQCVEAGADGFLLKPYMPDDLIQLIRAQES